MIPYLARFVFAFLGLMWAALPLRSEWRELPSRYDEDRFYVLPQTPGGQVVKFYTDTGGGYFLFADMAEKLGLDIRSSEQAGRVADLPAFHPGVSIPYSKLWGKTIRIFPADQDDSRFIRSLWEGMLGAEWFADGVWIFDYPGRRLLHSDQSASFNEETVKLGFKEEGGRRIFHYPRIQIEVDGKVLDMLFDTGATSILSEEALKILNDGRPSIRASSFITKSIFMEWRRRHPDWKVIEPGERFNKMPLILVPQVKIAGHTVGPAWFAMREDSNFHEWMSQWMDKRIDGAVGGNVLRHFRITVDYPQALASFSR